jgi:biofilm protein TabA
VKKQAPPTEYETGAQMVIDRIDNAAQYVALGPGIARGLEFLRSTDLASLTTGRHEVDGDRVYALVSEYTTRPTEQGRWEAHRRYLDLQSLACGSERIGWTPVGGLVPESQEDQKDVAWFTGAGQFLTLRPGDFMLLWPADAHMPGIALNEPVPVKKIVIKIAVG